MAGAALRVRLGESLVTMTDQISVQCPSCGKHTWTIAHVPGKQELVCPRWGCKSKAVVRISENGSLDVSKRGCFLASAILLNSEKEGELKATLTSLLILRKHIRRERGIETELAYYELSNAYLGVLNFADPEIRTQKLAVINFEFLQPILIAIKGNDFRNAFRLTDELLDHLDSEMKELRVDGT